MLAELKGLEKSFGGAVALDDLSMDVPPGTVVAVLGLNGAGKSTLLRVMAGVSSLDRGSLWYGGEAFHRERLDLRKEIVFTPDTPVFFPEKTVLQNLVAFLQIYERDLKAPGQEEELIQLMVETDIASLAQVRAEGLSRGQVWKLALACTSAIRPRLWLVDEPFASGMDVVGLAAFKKVARRLAEAGCTILYTTQLVDMAAAFSDRVCLLDRGKLRFWDTTQAMQKTLSEAGGEAATWFLKLRGETPVESYDSVR